jgi:Uncharacterized protein conserved in bacteria
MSTELTESNYARLSCRVSKRIKNQAEKAAALLGQSITDFTESALAEKAEATLERHERIMLSDRDFARFVALLENPPAPTQDLKDAVADYLSLQAQYPESNL